MDIKAFVVVMLLAYGLTAHPATAQLRAGDVAVVAFNTDGGDEFAWVALRNIPAQTQICFTDSSVSNGSFRWTEHLGDAVLPGPLTWIYTNSLPAGTVVTWAGGDMQAWSIGEHSGGWPVLSSEGDQLFIYCGTIVSREGDVTAWRGVSDEARLIYGLNFANGGWDNVTGGSTTASFVPPGLSTNLGTAVHVDTRDNGYYAGTRTGTAAEILQAISISTNWATSNEPFTSDQWPGTFSVLSDHQGSKFSMR